MSASSSSSSFAFISTPKSLNLTHLLQRNTSLFVFKSIPICLNSNPSSLSRVLFRVPHGSFKRSSIFTPSRQFFSPVMEWQDCTGLQCFRESIPRWMPFISSVKILEDKPDLSQWSLKYIAFGRDIGYSWLARNMQPILNKKIHWRSLEGLPNRGAVRFFPKGPSSYVVEALKPFLETLLRRGLDCFATFAKTN